VVEETLTTWYLEMLDRASLRPARTPDVDAIVQRAEIPSPALNRFLYTAVGGDWHWRDRLPWTYERWMRYLDRAEVQTWLLMVKGTPAGYIELEKQPGDDVEIVYFGLMRNFIGRGLGGFLLGAGIERAWAMGARRVWVHTCSLDHPGALACYQSRGLALYKTETQLIQRPERPDGPWPGADAA
jgi:ribosomal protein S18 acetylase RimI-like enzyme